MRGSLLIILSLILALGLQAKPQGKFVHVEGTDLVQPNGEKLYIQGTNLGNWLNPEGYMFGFSKTNSPWMIDLMIKEAVGPDFAADFWRQFKDNYITRADINFIARQGANTIRLPFNYRLFTDEDYMGRSKEQDGFARIDSVVNWCRAAGLYLILDMHDCPGGQTGDNIDDGHGYPWLFESEPSQQLFCDIWQRIAARYKDEPVILGYELMNEPIAHYFENKEELNKKLEPLYQRAIKAIRQVDTNHVILLGGARWNSDFYMFSDWKFDDNIMYTCHRYGGEATAEAIKDYIDFRDKTGLPMYMGETGHNTNEWQAQLVDVMKQANIGYTFWPYKKIDNSCMMGITRPEMWDSIVVKYSEAPRSTYKELREARPNQEMFRNLLMQYVENSRYEHCTPQMDYIQSLGLTRQTPIYLDETLPIEQRVEDALSRMTLDEKIPVIHAQSKFSSPGVKRLGMPDFWTDDGPHGVRPDVLWDEWVQAGQTNDSCVAFPALTCLAASWNPELAKLYGRSLGEEARYRGKDMILGPGVNINRTPLNGRNFEYMGEDPLLASRIVVPYVQGLQSTGIAACVKHFCLNNDEEYRHQVNVIVSDRALREIYLPAFEAAVKEGHTWGIMGSYNLYKDQNCCHNEYTLNRILKGDWQYDGVVVSDWGGTHNTEMAVLNGLDMEFGSWTDGLAWGASNAYDAYYLAKPYKKLIEEGKFTTRELDDKVRRVLRLFFRTTMSSKRTQGFLCSEAHYDAALKIAQDGIVLLQNKRNVLPIDVSNAKRILVVGENAIKMMTVGGGSSSLKVQHEILPLEGLKTRLAGTSIEVDYARGYVGDTTGEYNGVVAKQSLAENRSASELIAEAVVKAQGADYVIIFGGLNKSDYQDAEGHDRKHMDMPYSQDALVEALARVNKNVVFVNISGDAVAMPWRDKVAAIVQGWFIGSETGKAFASILMGDVNPSGKLPFTWYQSLNDVGAHALGAYPGTWREGHKIIDEEYKEGIYVGYRWADKQKKKPMFAFGHGLSYTTFVVSNLRIDKSEVDADGTISATVTVKNTGNRAGAEVVQLYVSDHNTSVEMPVKELRGFQKVSLQPGESRDVTITIGDRAFQYWDEAKGDWSVSHGKRTMLVGTASDNLPLKAAFTIR